MHSVSTTEMIRSATEHRCTWRIWNVL